MFAKSFVVGKRLLVSPDGVVGDARSAQVFIGRTQIGQAIPVLKLVVRIVIHAPAGAEFQVRRNFCLTINITDQAVAGGVHIGIVQQNIQVIKTGPFCRAAISINFRQISWRVQGRL